MVVALPRKRLGCQYRTNSNAKHQIKAESKKLGTRFLHFGSTIELWFRWTSSWICFRIKSFRDAKKGAKAKRRKKGITYKKFVCWLWYCGRRRLTDGSESAQNTSLSREHRRRHTIEHFSLPTSSPRWPHFHVLEVRSAMGAIVQTRVKYVDYGRMDLCVWGWGEGFCDSSFNLQFQFLSASDSHSSSQKNRIQVQFSSF